MNDGWKMRVEIRGLLLQSVILGFARLNKIEYNRICTWKKEGRRWRIEKKESGERRVCWIFIRQMCMYNYVSKVIKVWLWFIVLLGKYLAFYVYRGIWGSFANFYLLYFYSFCQILKKRKIVSYFSKWQLVDCYSSSWPLISWTNPNFLVSQIDNPNNPNKDLQLRSTNPLNSSSVGLFIYLFIYSSILFINLTYLNLCTTHFHN